MFHREESETRETQRMLRNADALWTRAGPQSVRPALDSFLCCDVIRLVPISALDYRLYKSMFRYIVRRKGKL